MGLLIKLLLSYLLGSVLGSLLLGRLRGVDVRQHGSGNAGATNALRVLGRGMACSFCVSRKQVESGLKPHAECVECYCFSMISQSLSFCCA